MVSQRGVKWKSVSMTSMVRILGLTGSGRTASARSRLKPEWEASFMALSSARSVSGAQDHLIAVELDFIGADFLVAIVAMLAGGQVERPIVPGAAHDLAAVRELAFAHGGALVDAAIIDREQLAVGAEHRHRGAAGLERHSLAFGNVVQLAEQIFLGHRSLPLFGRRRVRHWQ